MAQPLYCLNLIITNQGRWETRRGLVVSIWYSKGGSFLFGIHSFGRFRVTLVLLNILYIDKVCVSDYLLYLIILSEYPISAIFDLRFWCYLTNHPNFLLLAIVFSGHIYTRKYHVIFISM